MTDTQAPASLAEALAALQGRLPHVAKDAENPHFRSKYANLESITAALMPVLSSLGLSFVARPTFYGGLDTPNLFVLAWSLRHVSGESEDGFYPLPSGGTPQQVGSAITYARRYALCAVTGLAPGGDDDDGNAAEQAPPGPAAATAPAQRKAEQAARATPPAARQRRIAEERARHDDAGHDPAKVTRTRPKAPDPEDPWAGRPPEEREQAPGTVNDLQLRAIWMLLKDRAGVTDPDAGHAMCRAALALPDDALLTDPDENGEVRETFKRLSHAQAAEFIRQLQDGDAG